MIYAYIRVSTDKQTLENQEFEINNFAKRENLQIDFWITEKISGAKDPNKRKLGRLLKNLRSDDVLICTEISRLGRNLFQVMTILNLCMQKEVKVWTIKDNYRLGTDIQSKVLAFAFSLSAEIERNLISQRTKEALARLKASGRRLGRKIGSQNKKHVMDGKEQVLVKLLRRGMPKLRIARFLGVSPNSLYRFLKQNGMYKYIRQTVSNT